MGDYVGSFNFNQSPSGSEEPNWRARSNTRGRHKSGSSERQIGSPAPDSELAFQFDEDLRDPARKRGSRYSLYVQVLTVLINYS